jgi:hypothetical protein
MGISDISLLELATLASKGRIHLGITLESFLREVEARFVVLPISGRACARAMGFATAYPKDPAVRIIGATALVERQTGTRRRAGYEQANADYGSNEIRYEPRADVLSAGRINYKLVGRQVGQVSNQVRTAKCVFGTHSCINRVTMKKERRNGILGCAFAGLKQELRQPIFLGCPMLPGICWGKCDGAGAGEIQRSVYYDAHRIPFSRYGSYLAIQHVHASARIAPPLDALFLRTTIMSTQTGWKKRLCAGIRRDASRFP